MYAIALTSIPPRLHRLQPVLQSLLAQDPAPERVLLCLPHRWTRFAAPAALPAMPDTIEVVRSDTDFGPATKAIVAARLLAGKMSRLIYCDDDWIYPPGWASALLATQRPGEAVAATGFDIARLKRQSHRTGQDDGLTDIAQGYSGVLIDPVWLAGPEIVPPPDAMTVDDIWLSGQLARQRVPVRLAPTARAGLVPAFEDAHGLQDATGGRNRHALNLACLDLLTARYGLWQPM